MKRLAILSALTVTIASTSSCSWLSGPDGYFRDRGSDYLDAQQMAPIKLPPGFQTEKHFVSLLPIPTNVADENVRDGFQVQRPQTLTAIASTSDYIPQKDGDNRWVIAQQVPSKIWPEVMQFFQENGFHIDERHPRTGEFTTPWQRTEELSALMVRHIGNSGLPADSETRIRIRIERGVQRNTSEIYVVSANRPVGSTASLDFTSHSVNTDLDDELVDEVLISINHSAYKNRPASLLAIRHFDIPTHVALTEEGSGNLVLNLNEDLNHAWSSVGRALEQGDWRVEDINRTLCIYYINLAEKPEKRDEKYGFLSSLFSSKLAKEEVEARAQRYQVRLNKVGDRVQVTVEENINTVAPPEVARKVLGVIQDSMS